MDDKTRIMTRGKRVDLNQHELDDSNATPPSSDTTIFKPRQVKDQAGRDKTRIAAPVSPDKTRLKPAASPPPTFSDIVDEEANYGTLKGRFVFVEVLGAGGMGIVYKAKDLLKVEAQDREPYVAIKVLSEEFKAHPEAFIALQRESRKTQRMAHPNIVNVHDFDRDGDTVFMTMEYMEGMPLDKLISQYRSIGLPRDTVWTILEDIMAALIYAHEQNVIHSDFKPGNIFVTNNGTAKVFDFGIARAVAKAENYDDNLDDRTVFDAGNLGALTPAYASLEMLEGEIPDIRDDIYALGCIAYELFTGDHPYNRMHADEAKRQNIKAKRIPGISKKQWRAIERAMAFTRADRIESVEELWRELTEKKSQIVKIRIAVVVFIAVLGAVSYQYRPQLSDELSADQFRSEIERNLRIEMKKESLLALTANHDFTPAWEQDVWNDVQELRRLVGQEDEWLTSQESIVFQLYLNTIEERISAREINSAQAIIENAGRYGDSKVLEPFEDSIVEVRLAVEKEKEEERKRELARAAERRQEAERAAALSQKNSQFDQAMANVRRQLQCHSSINMSDFSIALGQLKSISAQRYASEEPQLTRALAACIEGIGASFPERAEAAKHAAMELFTRNATIAAIDIRPRDPCSLSLAGAGAKSRGASCRDHMADVQHPPVMVVIPGSEAIKAFAIGQTEVTVEQINEFCKASNTCQAVSAASAGLPAHQISLTTANAYLKWLSDQSGYRYRLPSRVEWQHAASANNSRLDSNRNCHLNSRGISKGNALVRASVGQRNNWGLVNHLGNAQEWVSDRGGRLLAIGGSYETPMDQCHGDFTIAHNGEPDAITGFRVLRELAGQ